MTAANTARLSLALPSRAGGTGDALARGHQGKLVQRAYVARLEYGERAPERDTLIALLLASYSLPVRQANRLPLLAGYAPMHHKAIAKAA